jgi:hypothetical protein
MSHARIDLTGIKFIAPETLNSKWLSTIWTLQDEKYDH